MYPMEGINTVGMSMGEIGVEGASKPSMTRDAPLSLQKKISLRGGSSLSRNPFKNGIHSSTP